MTNCLTLPEALAPQSGATRGSYDELAPLSEVRLICAAWFGSTSLILSCALSLALLLDPIRKLQRSLLLGGGL
jgi:hypothetical protein